MKENWPLERVIKYAAVSFFCLIVVFSSFGTISVGERGVKTRMGTLVGIIQTGPYFKLPFVEGVDIIEVKTRTINYDQNGNEGDRADSSQLSGASKDLQDVWIGVVINYHIDPTKVSDIYSQYRSTDSYESVAIEPEIRASVKAVTAQYTAEELVTKRAEVSDNVTRVLAEKLAVKGALLETASITNFEFSPSFTQAIEAKVTATQNAEAAKNKLEQVKFEAQQTIEQAKATAEAQRIQAQSLAAQGGSDYVQLKALEKWDGHLPTQMIPGSSVPFINLNN